MTPSPIPPLPPLLPALEIETGPSPTASVIWLHGLGADGHDFAPVVPELRLPPGTPTRFIFPHAPEIPVTLNVGQVMPAWFDSIRLTLMRPRMWPGLLAAWRPSSA